MIKDLNLEAKQALGQIAWNNGRVEADLQTLKNRGVDEHDLITLRDALDYLERCHTLLSGLYLTYSAAELKDLF